MKPSRFTSPVRWFGLAATATFACVSLVVAGCGAKQSSEAVAAPPAQATEPQPVAVTVAPVETRAIQRTVQVVGEFVGRNEVTIAPKVDGRIVRIHHDVGDVIEPGQLLVEIDDTDYRLAMQEAKRAVESELAKLGLAELPPNNFDVTHLPTVERSRLLVEHSESRFRRIESLAVKNITTKDEFDQARTDFNVAQANYRQAVMDARAILATARHKIALLATAEQKLADTKITAPALSSFSGTLRPTGKPSFSVAERRVSEGEMLQAKPPTAILKLVVDNPLKLMATVPERHVSDVRVGQNVGIAVEAYPGEVFQGQVARINPTIDRASRTFQIEVLVPNDSRQLKCGNFAKAAIQVNEDPRAMTVPAESLVTFAGVTKVFIVRDGKAFPVDVRPGVRGGEWLEVSGDLAPGMPVVTSGYTKLAEGTPVRVRENPSVKLTATRPVTR